MPRVQDKPRAIILTGGLLHHGDAKTAHGLIRGTERYCIAAVIDELHAGRDAGEVIDGHRRNLPVFATVEEAVSAITDLEYCIIGIATVGGMLPDHFIGVIESCIRHRLSIVNGLHDLLTDSSGFVTLAREYGVTLTDIRKQKPVKDLHFWSGNIYTVTAPVIAVIGTDCALGKRTTCRMLRQACEAEGIRAEMIYTGQTGWLQGGAYGFIFDSTINDFISGELEHSIVSCWKETSPDIIFLEGQSALRNPSGPCGAELLVSGNAKQVVLVHAPKRIHYEHEPSWGAIHTVRSEIELIGMYGSTVTALALNTEDCTAEEAFAFQRQYETALNIPVLLPLQEGVDKIIPFIKQLVR